MGQAISAAFQTNAIVGTLFAGITSSRMPETALVHLCHAIPNYLNSANSLSLSRARQRNTPTSIVGPMARAVGLTATKI